MDKKIADILYNLCLDMDYADSMEHSDTEISMLAKELGIARELELNSLIYVCETIAARNKDFEGWIERRNT